MSREEGKESLGDDQKDCMPTVDKGIHSERRSGGEKKCSY